MDGYHPVLGLAILAAMALSFLAVLIALVILIWKRRWTPALLIAIAALWVYPLWWHWLMAWGEQ
ncbi:MAG TPA: hypothetical protein VG733_08000, partial [Chthoniobacteraceae bacterium]|nr:hypothetical protein [Chthoniobacteraceae bacterium]